MMTNFPLLSITLFLPLLGAILLMAFKTGRKGTNIIAVGTAFLTLLGTLGMAWRGLGTGFSQVEEVAWIPQLDVAYRVGIDGISFTLVLLTGILFLSSIVFSTKIKQKPRAYMALFLMLETACLGVFMSLDLLLFYVFFEITLVGMYFIIVGWGHENAKKAGVMFFIYTLVGSLLLLLAFLALYLNADPRTFDMRALIENPPVTGGIAVFTFWALFLAFAIKTPLFPFHSWLPLAHTEAPAAGSAILAGILLKLGAYGFIRFMLQMTPEMFREFAWVVMAVAVFSVVYGALVAMAQTDLKRMVAYTSINHMGYLVFGVAVAAVGSESAGIRGLDGATLQMFSHGIVTGLLFLLIGAIQDRVTTREIPVLKGLLKSYPLLSGFFVVAAFASLGLPGLAHFPAEFQIFLGGFEDYPWAVVIMLLGLVIISATYVRSIQRSFMGAADRNILKMVKDLNARELLAFVPLLILIILTGVYPDWILKYIHETVKLLM
ncbi:NADH dehydrogenase subunit M [Gillisia sp. Hel_I_86]|uniref:complex I subunit 4 family protein n=1 Tax=Gillisia sp. Hel_I_86 TaxID=1249981 RepID=UPI00119C2A94|nr:NADH-quinone oxidoreductase subunit M [Gillisia sp. Hel_I_86]TVZ28634.1 NADH dehydrogenase subunit M [Gillisia sp. Hel_I_86]